MRIEIVTPAPMGSHHGNRVTAQRWARMLTELGHEAAITTTWSGEPVDALVALHAMRSAGSACAFAAAHPDRPLVVALTGTDLYRDLPDSAQAQQAVAAASALVVLQPLARDAVPAHLGERVHVIHQSVTAPDALDTTTAGDAFEVVVLAHLRAVKDPFLAAAATRRLPANSRVRVTHCGAPIDPGTEERARAETATNPRYRWLGDVPREEALRHLAASRLLLLTSRLEGGANAVSEALAAGVPVLSTRVDGSVGLLGADYPGYVEVGDVAGLARLLRRAETDPAFLADLTTRVAARRELVDPERERRAWAELLARVTAGAPDP
ncbi:MAG: TIGR04348 family glycosyltransferase [Pseudonocardiaceae bacterium]|nr:TIGR04348 family glycosyltransferase [Pseudonocardiaceae bacterium]